MLRDTDETGMVRTIVLISSFAVAAAIGLTMVAGRGLGLKGRSGALPQGIFFMALAGLLCIVNLVLRCVHRAKAKHTDHNEKKLTEVGGFMQSEIMQEVLKLIKIEAESRPSAFEYELAYQARVAIDRIRFAIKHTEQFGHQSSLRNEAGMQLLDALERLERVDRKFQERSRGGAASTTPKTGVPDSDGQGGKSLAGLRSSTNAVSAEPRR